MKYWDERVETMGRAELEALQLERLRATVARALLTPFYKPLLEAAGVTGPESIRTLADLSALPFTSKDDLRKAYPYGLLACPKEELVRLHASSGTTGTPTVIYQTRDDLGRWTDYMARSLAAAGATSEDVFQNMITYGLFTGGLGLHQGAERLGMMVIPAGPGNVGRQLKFMKDFGTTTVHATPSFMLHFQSKMAEEGYSRSDLALKRAFCGAEPYSEDARLKIEGLLGIDVFNSYGLSEMNGPGLAFECVHKAGMHVWEDGFLLEVIDPDTGLAVPDGEPGELVFTILCRDAMPLLRYRTHDISSVIPGRCECGRTHRRIARITGRTDDMLIINGVNVFPSQVEEVLMRMPEIGTNWLIVVSKDGALDRLTVKTEVQPSMFSDDSRPLNALREHVRERLQASISIGAHVELHEPGSLPVSEGKAKRVLDERPRL
jgi:phenylacetate-CoA ligase